MKKYDITGMSCAACSARVEKAVSALSGVKECSVNLLTGTLCVDTELEDEVIVGAVCRAGYGASPKREALPKRKTDGGKEKAILYRLLSSVILLLPLMYLSMGHVMLGAPLPALLSENPVAIGGTQMFLSALILFINKRFFINGFKGIISLAPNMDTLVSLGSGISFVYSAVNVALMCAPTADAARLLHELYFESAAMILTLITVGKLLEQRAKGRATDAIGELMDLSPKTARVYRDGKEVTVDSGEVRIGDIFILRSGDGVPVDGVIVEGECSLVESALTGESMPRDKTVGDKVFAATLNSSGYVKCRATSVGTDTVISGVIRLVEEAAATKAPISKIADRVSGFFVPVIASIAALTFFLWWAFGGDIGYAVGRAISVLVISCPCALGLATPVAIMVGSGVGAKNGILYKTAEAIELTARARSVVLDKTGTVTKGEPEVVGVYPAEGVSEETLLSVALSVEERSEHPQARAVVAFSQERVRKFEINGFKTVAGSGVVGEIDGERVIGGNKKFVSENASIPDSLLAVAAKLSEEGKTTLFFARGGSVIGMIATADALREDSKEAVNELRDMGLSVTLLTGDGRAVSENVAERLGIERVVSEVLPDRKADTVKALAKDGRVIMVGDGINDAPALTVADVGMAIGGGCDIAMESADVVLVRSSLSDVVSAVRLGRRVVGTVKENLFFAFVYNLVGIPMAAGLFGFSFPPMFGAIAMSLSSLSVVLNSLRIGRFGNKTLQKQEKTNENQAAKNIQKEAKGIEKMEIILKVEGMMCPHCEARVREALSAVSGVEQVEVDHKKGEARIKGPAEVKILISTVEAAGYKASV